MKKLKQLKLQSAVALLEKEMKAVYGGSGDDDYGSGCEATCSGSESVRLTNCPKTCISRHNEGAFCVDDNMEIIAQRRCSPPSGGGGSGTYYA